MKRNIKHTALIVGSVAALAVAGCSTSRTGGDGGGSDADGDLSMVFVNPLPNLSQWKLIGKCMGEEAKRQGIEFTETGPSGSGIDATQMTQQVQQAISNQSDIIVTYPASDGFAALLQQAQEAGITTGTLYGTGEPDSGALFNLGFDWTELGRQFAQTVGERSGPQNVGMIAVGDTGVGKQWIEGFEESAAEVDNVEVVGKVYTNDDSAKALPQTQALLSAHPDINVVVSHMGTATQGSVAAISNAGLQDEVVFIGNGPDYGGFEALESGIGYRMLVQALCLEGKETVATALQVMEEEPTSVVNVPVEVEFASTETLDDLLKDGWR